MENLRRFGGEGESIAKEFLISKGYSVITQNYGIARGEIDLIALNPLGDLVFVEVKRVRGASYGTAEEKVTPEKLKTIRRVAEHYIVTHKLEGVACQVDVVAINDDDVRHVENCFSL